MSCQVASKDEVEQDDHEEGDAEKPEKNTGHCDYLSAVGVEKGVLRLLALRDGGLHERVAAVRDVFRVQFRKTRLAGLHHLGFHKGGLVFGLLRNEDVRGRAREEHVAAGVLLRGEARGIAVAVDALALLIIDDDVGDAVARRVSRPEFGKVRIGCWLTVSVFAGGCGPGRGEVCARAIVMPPIRKSEAVVSVRRNMRMTPRFPSER